METRLAVVTWAPFLTSILHGHHRQCFPGDYWHGDVMEHRHAACAKSVRLQQRNLKARPTHAQTPQEGMIHNSTVATEIPVVLLPA
jgi:hypothetical protein